MATRASHSSPCFLRVAEARAASSASKITSLSTPFSLETASTTIRISLFTILSTSPELQCSCGYLPAASPALRGQPRLANLGERHRHLLPIHFEGDAALVHREELPGVTAPAGARLLQLDEHPRADEAPEVRRRAQHAVKPRRGHLERVRARDRVLGIEQTRELPAHLLAIVQSHTLGPVDEHAHQRVPAVRGVLQVH